MKKYIISLFIIISIFLFGKLFAENIEDIFSDLDSDYTYYDELQTLYDAGYFTDSGDGEGFDSDEKLEREDFIEVVVKYNLENTYFCSEGGTDCLEEKIKLKEVLEIMFVNSGLFSLEDNGNELQKINDGTLTETISNDVPLKNGEGVANYYYPFFKEALETNYSEILIDGNEKNYYIVQTDLNNNLNPDKEITKGEFVNMFYIFYKLTGEISFDETEDLDSQLTNACLGIEGEDDNYGCPILDETCLEGSELDTCDSGFTCSSEGYCEIDKQVVNKYYSQGNSSIFGNVICDTCPCGYEINFLANLRKYDILIPAITSPDQTKIYSKGDGYELPSDF